MAFYLLLTVILQSFFCTVADNAAVKLTGTGTGMLILGLQEAQFAYQVVRPTTQVAYIPTTSVNAVCSITGDASFCPTGSTDTPFAVDFASSIYTLTPAEYAKYPDLQMYPIFVGALVPIFNLGAVRDLTLSMTVLAKIFSGDIRYWDDPRIISSNPMHSAWDVPPRTPIEVVFGAGMDELSAAFLTVLPEFYPNFTRPTPNATLMPHFVAITAYVMNKKYTISYSGLDFASAFNLPMAKLLKGGVAVEASIRSMTYATLELGLSFGNNGDDPAHLTADLNNARGVNAWPMASYVYLIMRKETLRPGASCDNVRETVRFFQWFLESELVAESLAELRFAPLPSVVRDFVVARFVSDIRCEEEVVWTPTVIGNISGAGMSLVAPIFAKLGRVYVMLHNDVKVSYHACPGNQSIDAENLLHTSMFVAFSGATPVPIVDGAKLAFAGFGLAVLSQYDFILDLPMLVKILNGNITTWLHPDLMALNPNGIINAGTKMPITDVNQPIIIFRGPTFDTPNFKRLMNGLPIPYTGAALTTAIPFTEENVMRFTTSGVPFTMTITTFSGDKSGLTPARIKRPDGNIVAPTWQSIQACASVDAFDGGAGMFQLHKSLNSSCYPLSDTIYLGVKRSKCNLTSDADRTQTVKFSQWLLSGGADEALKQQNMAPLWQVPGLVTNPNAQGLHFLDCDIPPAQVPWGPILGGALGAFLLLVVIVGIYAWKSTKELRAMRKQFSDSNVAQECAEAISHFDLDTVEWLYTVSKPSPIQQAFIRIMRLLTEVKPFIPDQLLATLTAAHLVTDDMPDDVHEPEHPMTQQESYAVESASIPSQSRKMSDSSATTQPHKRSLRSGSEVSTATGTTTVDERVRYGKFTSRLKLTGGPASRKCTYMYIQFGIKGCLESPEISQMGLATARIINLAKTYGATVDKVTFDTVALHWNVVVNNASAPVRATMLALEIMKIGDDLPPAVQGLFWVRVGLGHGLCTATTVSAAGQRFFVIAGSQVALPISIVTHDVASKCKCSLLITNEVYKEVQYAVHCFPRLWFRDNLLWEPVALRKSESNAGEWMYELHNIEGDEHGGYNEQVLLEPFMMVRNGKSPTLIAETIAALKMTHGLSMTMQDLASLDQLLPALPCTLSPTMARLPGH